jgi:hypothetical protein
MNTPDAYDRRPMAQDARTLTREHFFSGPRVINTTVTGEMLDDIRISYHAAPEGCRVPGFPVRGPKRGPRVRLSLRKAAWSASTPIDFTGNPGYAPFRKERRMKATNATNVSQEIRVRRIGLGAIRPASSSTEHI